MAKHIKNLNFGKDARSELMKGINLVGDSVGSTMGARGRNILYETAGGKPKSTKDGVTVANQIFLDNPLHSIGAELIKEASENTVNECGDATTGTIVLAREIIKLANDEVNKGSSPIELKRGVDDATKDILEILTKSKKNIKKKDYFDIANISSNNDKDLGKVISEAFSKAGKNGAVLHDKSDNNETTVSVSDGMLIDRGYSNKTMITDIKKDVMELDNPYIFVSDKVIDNFGELRYIFEFILKEKKNKVPLLIIGELSRETEDLLNANKNKNNIQVFYLKAPSFGSKRTELLDDIALSTGTHFFKKDSTDLYEVIGVQGLGRCESVKSTSESTILKIKNKDNESVNSRIKDLEALKKKANANRYKLQRQFLEERIAKLSCSVATIKVGANSEVELDEKIDRVDDAVNALKSAIQEGIVLGGGLALFNASFALDIDSKKSEDYIKGYHVVQQACRKPISQILENAGADVDDILNEITSFDKASIGYDVNRYEFADFYKTGIIDPYKAIRASLQNASSVASTFLLTNTTITIKRNYESNTQ